MKKYLFLFTIGPVKSFISNSRKAQDLFAGSAILSYLCEKAIKKAIELFEPVDIITPDMDSTSPPNRFVAEVSGTRGQLKDIATEIETYIRKKFKQIPDKVFKRSFTKPNGFDEQLDDFLKIEWLFYPLENDKEAYKRAYKQLFVELAAIKNTKTFAQLNYQGKMGEGGRKCSVDGEYNLKTYRLGKHENKLNILKRKLFVPDAEVNIIDFVDETRIKIWEVQDGEGLSAISFCKRIFLANPHKFPSTVRISLMDLLYKMKDCDELKNYLKKIGLDPRSRDQMWLTHSDDQLLFKDNIKQIFGKYENVQSKSCVEAQEQHRKLQEKISAIEKEKNIKIPFTKYYAMVMFDGDNMGNWLLGDNLKEETDLKSYHKEFTKCVASFATEMNKLSEPKGVTVFAGGEDFMGFVNIHHLFDTLNFIKNKYDELINQPLSKYFKDDKEKMTISIGVVIAHYKQPLGMVLQKTHEMIDLAKESGRNRFAIGVMKHSGSRLECTFPWEKDNISPLGLLEEIQEKLKSNDFSSSFILNIYRAFEEYGFDLNHDLVNAKIKQNVPRSATPNGKKEDIQKLIKQLVDLYSVNADDDAEIDLEILNENFGNALLIIDFLDRKTTSKE